MKSSAIHRGFTLIELMVAVFITAIVLSMGYGAVNQALASHDALDARQERLRAVQTAVRLITQDFTQLAPRPVRQPLGDGWLPAMQAGASMGSSLGLSGVNAGTGPGSLGQGLGASPGTPAPATSTSGSSSTGLGASLGTSTGTTTSLGTSTSTTTGAGTFTSSNTAQTIMTFTRAGWANPAGIQRPALERVTYILENGTLRREHSPVLDAVMTTATVRRDLLDKVKSVTVRYMDLSFNWREQWPPQALAGDPNANLRLRPIAVEVTLELEDWGKIVRVIEIAA
jgi:type II secretion system protein J